MLVLTAIFANFGLSGFRPKEKHRRVPDLITQTSTRRKLMIRISIEELKPNKEKRTFGYRHVNFIVFSANLHYPDSEAR